MGDRPTQVMIIVQSNCRIAVGSVGTGRDTSDRSEHSSSADPLPRRSGPKDE